MKKEDVKKWLKDIVITDVSRDHPDDNRISSCEIYQLGEDKDGNQEYFLKGDLPEEEIVELIDKNWSVKTGKLIGTRMSLGADVEQEIRIKQNGTKYPLSKMGRR